MGEPDRRAIEREAIPARERLIVALDVEDQEQALELVAQLGDAAWFYKVGFQLLLHGDYRSLLGRLRALDKRIFLDLKLFDVPATVAAAVRQLEGSGVDFVTVHGHPEMLRAACEARPPGLRILAVTVLTSLDQSDLDDPGAGRGVEALVLARARLALEAGCDGVVASGLEAAALRRELGPGFLIVAPGIRPAGERPPDDQKRVVTVEQALAAGVDHLVVGRPIRGAGGAAERRAAAQAIQAAISRALS